MSGPESSSSGNNLQTNLSENSGSETFSNLPKLVSGQAGIQSWSEKADTLTIFLNASL